MTRDTGHRVSACRSCGAQVVWMENPKTGKKMPVNAETVEKGDEHLDLGHQTSHFATCPQADKWRRR